MPTPKYRPPPPDYTDYVTRDEWWAITAERLRDGKEFASLRHLTFGHSISLTRGDIGRWLVRAADGAIRLHSIDEVPTIIREGKWEIVDAIGKVLRAEAATLEAKKHLVAVLETELEERGNLIRALENERDHDSV